MRRVLLMAAVLLAACRQDMHDGSRIRPLQASTFFADGRASRPPLPGTVARGQLREDDHLYRGRVAGELAKTFPIALSRGLVARGRERYDIYCAPCHDRTGSGQGMVVRRGFKRPPSFHQPRLREAPVGHFYDVITNGFGVMNDYAAQIRPEDRWAVVAYVRALQRSQNATIVDVPADERARLGRSR